MIVLALLAILSTPARAELPIYVDTYDHDGRLVKSKWLCANGRGTWPYCKNKKRLFHRTRESASAPIGHHK